MIADLGSMSVAQKVGQLFFIGIAGPEIDDSTKALLDEVSPGGVCLFARNIREASQIRELLDGLRETLNTIPFLSIDQEGGTVDRLRRIMTPMPAAATISNAKEAGELAAIIGETLGILGFNMDFAPVVDVVDEGRSGFSNGLTSRTFGQNKDEVTAFAGEFLQVLQSKGILGCIKHFPGLGASRVDSHEELPEVGITEDEFLSTDIFPYREIFASSEVHAVMAAHACFPRVSLQETAQNGKLLPSSLSYNFVTTLLRGQLAFDGLVITDDLEMGAIVKNFGIGDACKMAIAAGVDMLAICANAEAVREGYHGVLEAVMDGEISGDRLDRSISRIGRLKKQLSPPAEFDSDRLEELSTEIAALTGHLSR
jgi:beta-N-acetylhexosaminidase